MKETILIVDDEESIRTSLAGILEDEGFRPVAAVDGIEAIEIARRESPALVLLDIWMPRLGGLETLQRLKELSPSLTIIMMSGHGTIETAVKSTKMGAYDFIEKPLSLEKVILTVQNALKMSQLREENESLRAMAMKDHEVIGISRAMTIIRDQIRLIAPTSASVLISGEQGTGKGLIARNIHYNSHRRDKPFIEINCAAIPEELIESELFGHERGAIPGASSQKKGKLDLAENGTLFLNEIAEVPPKVQAKIFRLLEENVFERVGGNRNHEIDARIIAATNRNLDEETRLGRFREDLFYRLNVVPFNVPSLRARREDIPHLIEYFLKTFSLRESRELKLLVPEAVEMMQRYDWPGNVRELKNIMERLVIMNPGSTISAGQLPGYITAGVPPSIGAIPGHDLVQESTSLREAREEFEKEFILQKLEEHDWNISKTAEAIELERSNLHRKIRSYGLDVRKESIS